MRGDRREQLVRLVPTPAGYPERDPQVVVIYYDLGRARTRRARAHTGHDAKLLDVPARPRWWPRGRLGGCTYGSPSRHRTLRGTRACLVDLLPPLRSSNRRAGHRSPGGFCRVVTALAAVLVVAIGRPMPSDACCLTICSPVTN
jgi:hypothetical protein